MRDWKEQHERHLQDVIDSHARQRAEQEENFIRQERRIQDQQARDLEVMERVKRDKQILED